jgi:hypothetical protein
MASVAVAAVNIATEVNVIVFVAVVAAVCSGGDHSSCSGSSSSSSSTIDDGADRISNGSYYDNDISKTKVLQ